ncbi:hypothetical protein N9Y60_05665 [Crocinitomicaceae bacterium]|nr:hypothetical protein [Crocinitomicaceae bacterium]
MSYSLHAQPDSLSAEVILSYTDGTTSVSKEKINEREFVWRFFDKNGNQTYSLEEMHESYSVTVELLSIEDGRVKSVKQTIRPGGSRSWSESITYFEGNNQPKKLVKETLPWEDLSAKEQNCMFWNPEKRQWSTEKP